MDKAGSATVRLGHWVSLTQKCAGLCHAYANGHLVSLESHRRERMSDRQEDGAAETKSMMGLQFPIGKIFLISPFLLGMAPL